MQTLTKRTRSSSGWVSSTSNRASSPSHSSASIASCATRLRPSRTRISGSRLDMFTSSRRTMGAPRRRMSASSQKIRVMRRSSSSSDGCTTRTGAHSRVRILQSHISQRVSRRTLPTRSPGIYLGVRTWRARNTTRRTRRTSKQSTAMGATRRSGAPLVCSTSRSTNSATPSTRTRARSASTRTSARCGTTWGLSTRAAITRLAMRLMRMRVRASWIRII